MNADCLIKALSHSVNPLAIYIKNNTYIYIIYVCVCWSDSSQQGADRGTSLWKIFFTNGLKFFSMYKGTIVKLWENSTEVYELSWKSTSGIFL